MMNRAIFVLITCVVILAQTASAYDDNRKGFVVGLGGGGHRTTLDSSYSYAGRSGSASQSEAGIATSFRIGFGFTEQLALYYIRSASWFDAYDDTIVTGISGLGIAYYLSPSAPSVYLLGAAGVGDISGIDSSSGSDTGVAFMFGGGYELIPHVQFELTYLAADIDDDYGIANLQTSSLLLTINYLWY